MSNNSTSNSDLPILTHHVVDKSQVGDHSTHKHLRIRLLTQIPMHRLSAQKDPIHRSEANVGLYQSFHSEYGRILEQFHRQL